MFLTGSGLNVTCINMMLTQRFKPDDDRRESAFLWNYAGMNLGFFVGFTVAGYFQLTENYRALFLFATLGNAAAIIVAVCRWRILADLNTPLHDASRSQPPLAHAGRVSGAGGAGADYPRDADPCRIQRHFVIVLGALIFLMLCVVTLRHHPRDERRRMAAYLIPALGSLVFWALYQLAPMGLMLFSEHNINLNVYGIQVAPQWIQNINTLVIVVGGPLLARWFNRLRARGCNIDIPLQFSGSLFCIGLGMLVLPLGISMAGGNGLVAFKWIVISYVLQSVGELMISPIGYAMIGKLAPPRYQGVMMGCWMMVTGVASVLAGYVSGLMPENSGSTPLQTNPGYSEIFSVLGWGRRASAWRC